MNTSEWKHAGYLMNKQIRKQEDLKRLIERSMYSSSKTVNTDPESVEGLFKLWDKNKKNNHHHISIDDKLTESGLLIASIL